MDQLTFVSDQASNHISAVPYLGLDFLSNGNEYIPGVRVILGGGIVCID